MTTDFSIASLRERLNAQRGNWPRLAEISGLSYSLLCKFAAGTRSNPTFDSIERLDSALRAIEQQAPDIPPASEAAA